MKMKMAMGGIDSEKNCKLSGGISYIKKPIFVYDFG